MAERYLSLVLPLLALVVGLSAGATLGFLLTPVQEVVREVPVNNTIVREVQVPTQCEPEVVTEVVNNTVEVPVADASLFLNEATDAVFSTESWGLGDDSDFLTCDGHEFDLNEVSIRRIDRWSYTWLDDDRHSVEFDAVFEFSDNSDERDCTEHRSYLVEFEDGEDPQITTL